MLTGEGIARKAFEKSKCKDWETFREGWYSREKLSSHSRESELYLEVEEKHEAILHRVADLYRHVPDNYYMGHDDPRANIMCLLGHVMACIREFVEKRVGEQMLMFDIDIPNGKTGYFKR